MLVAIPAGIHPGEMTDLIVEILITEAGGMTHTVAQGMIAGVTGVTGHLGGTMTGTGIGETMIAGAIVEMIGAESHVVLKVLKSSMLRWIF